MKIFKKPSAQIDFSKVNIATEDDQALDEMKNNLRVMNRHFSRQLEKGDMNTDQIPTLTRVCDVYVRICEEQRKRNMIRAYKK